MLFFSLTLECCILARRLVTEFSGFGSNTEASRAVCFGFGFFQLCEPVLSARYSPCVFRKTRGGKEEKNNCCVFWLTVSFTFFQKDKAMPTKGEGLSLSGFSARTCLGFLVPISSPSNVVSNCTSLVPRRKAVLRSLTRPAPTPVFCCFFFFSRLSLSLSLSLSSSSLLLFSRGNRRNRKRPKRTRSIDRSIERGQIYTNRPDRSDPPPAKLDFLKGKHFSRDHETAQSSKSTL